MLIRDLLDELNNINMKLYRYNLFFLDYSKQFLEVKL